MKSPRLPIVSTMLCLLAWAVPAGASLKEDAARVTRAIEQAGGRIVSRSPTFLEKGQFKVVSLSEAKDRCVSLVLLGTRSTSFAMLTTTSHAISDAELLDLSRTDSRRRQESAEGAVVFSSCTDPATANAVLLMLSARGTVEVLVVDSQLPITSLARAVGRETVASPAAIDLGPPLIPAALPERRRRAEARAIAEGATNVLPLEMQAGPHGNGEIKLRLPGGCHRLDLMAENVAPESGPWLGGDLDAELRTEDGKEVLSRDRGETPDARVEACIGEATMLSLLFRGAPPTSRVITQDAFFPLPKWAKDVYGPRALAGLVKAARRRIRQIEPSGPFFESLGAQGSTTMGVSVEPGRCYLAVAALTRGTSRGLRLIANAASVPSYEEVPAPEDAAAVTFCAETDLLTLSVDAPGASVSWVVGLYGLFPRASRGSLAERDE